MSAWVELMIKGGSSIFLEAGHIKGVIRPSGLDMDTPATPDNTLTVVMMSGAELPGVYGLSVTRLLFRLAGARESNRRKGTPITIVTLDSGDTFDAEVYAWMSGGQHGEAG